MPNLILSPTMLLGLLIAIVLLLIFILFFVLAIKGRLDTIVRQQRELVGVLSSARERGREIEPETRRPSRTRAEPHLLDDEDPRERAAGSRPAMDLVARR